MFSKLVAGNSKKNRKDNQLYFSSMIISIFAFYIILSLSHQDVMLFLRKMESDAVERLLSLVPAFYVTTLVILLFLVYFAGSVQIERRKHEFGVYLTLGMKRKTLFLMLLLEDFRNNLIALGIGLPLAVMISEFISLFTSKVVGLGVIGHRFSLSYVAIFFTILGFVIVKLMVCIFLSAKAASKEIGELLRDTPTGERKQFPKMVYFFSIPLGIAMLGKAYSLGISGTTWEGLDKLGITIVLGIAGTIILFFGMRIVIGFLVKIGRGRSLHTYNFRQIEEMVIYRSTLLGICSLLIFSALCFFAAGIAVSSNRSYHSMHVLDYTFRTEKLGEPDKTAINTVKKKLKTGGLLSQFSDILEIKIGYPKEHDTLRMEEVINQLEKMKQSHDSDSLLRNMKSREDVFLISLEGYNQLRKSAGLEQIELKNEEAVMYIGKIFLQNEDLLNSVITTKPKIELMGKTMTLTGKIESLPIVTDRMINIYMALIVSDKVFESFTGDDYSTYVSGVLDSKLVKEKGLTRAIYDTNAQLDEASIIYESYLQNIGRQLFYIISASYVTIYLAIIFLVVANTMIGVQFLMGQRKSYKRYQILIHLGVSYETLCKSARKQIHWFFGLPLLIAIINSYFGVQSLFAGILPFDDKNILKQQMMVAIPTILLLGIFEGIYIWTVKKNSDHYLRTLMEPKREES